jgi:hypothetical protein
VGGRATAVIAVLATLLIAGCGGSSKSKTATGGGGGGNASAPSGVLSAEAQSAATGDIPDTQVFLTYTDTPAGYSIKYPEGWAQRGSGPDVTFQDKNNVIHVTVSKGAAPTPASVAAQLAREKAGNTTLTAGKPQTLSYKAGPVVKVSYTTQSAPNPVTGKRVTLIVDRYEYARGGKVATADLGTAKGVDNIDAYRMISQSFRWR